MDGTRFDDFARSLASRVSRRAALRGGGAAGLASLFATGGRFGRPAPGGRQGSVTLLSQGVTQPCDLYRFRDGT